MLFIWNKGSPWLRSDSDNTSRQTHMIFSCLAPSPPPPSLTYTPVSVIHSLLKFVEFSSNILKMYTIQMISAWGQSNLLNDLIEEFFWYDLIKCKNNHNHNHNQNQNYVMSQHWAGLIFFIQSFCITKNETTPGWENSKHFFSFASLH